jgi:hypothetical protein
MSFIYFLIIFLDFESPYYEYKLWKKNHIDFIVVQIQF